MDSYAVALVWVLSPCCAATAGLVCTWIHDPGPLTFLRVHAALMLGTLTLALTVVGVDLPSGRQPWRVLLLVALGSLTGWLAVRAYDLVLGRYRRRQHYPMASLSPRSRPASQGVRYVRPDLAGRHAPRSGVVLAHLVVCAGLEELLFRGVIVSLAFTVPVAAGTVMVLTLSVAMFGAAHADLGLGQALAVLPLGLLALASVLVSGSVVPAVVAHVVMNVRAWWVTRQRPDSVPGPEAVRAWRPTW
jgi:hypothetical protein